MSGCRWWPLGWSSPRPRTSGPGWCCSHSTAAPGLHRTHTHTTAYENLMSRNYWVGSFKNVKTTITVRMIKKCIAWTYYILLHGEHCKHLLVAIRIIINMYLCHFYTWGKGLKLKIWSFILHPVKDVEKQHMTYIQWRWLIWWSCRRHQHSSTSPADIQLVCSVNVFSWLVHLNNWLQMM